jgi:hypothetical protein
MIECEGKKITPKEAAKKVIHEILTEAYDWSQNSSCGQEIYEKVTDREQILIHEQVRKLVLRINLRYL